VREFGVRSRVLLEGECAGNAVIILAELVWKHDPTAGDLLVLEHGDAEREGNDHGSRWRDFEQRPQNGRSAQAGREIERDRDEEEYGFIGARE
jgi:hypothetical protein